MHLRLSSNLSMPRAPTRAAPAPRATLAPRARLPGVDLGSIRVSAAPEGRPQPKLTLGAPGDAYEREADAVAERVMREEDPVLSGQVSGARVQRACAACAAEEEKDKVRRQPLGEGEKEEEEDEVAMAKPAAGGLSGGLSAGASAAIQSARGGGAPLDAGARARLEPRFGYDFSGVRVHADRSAAALARGLGARAFTVGGDVFFGEGQYDPRSRSGQRLLAHELTHVVQQGGGARGAPAGVARATPGPMLQRQAAVGQPPSTFEELVICLIMCMCELAPNVSVAGASLRQACVSQTLDQIDAQVGGLSTMKAEVSYDMTQTPPRPIMSGSNPLRPAGQWGVWWYIRRNMPRFVPGTGMIRRPDVVIQSNPMLGPVQGNLRRVVEIKFPGDVLSQAQRTAYQQIAGTAAQFVVLTTDPGSCNCDLVRQVLAEALQIALEMLLISLLIAALVADDATGVGTADDVAIPPLAARLALLAARLGQLVPRAAPLVAPLLQGAR